MKGGSIMAQGKQINQKVKPYLFYENKTDNGFKIRKASRKNGSLSFCNADIFLNSKFV
jgi:hypothetical protein